MRTLTLGCVMLAAAPAHADWQYTRWGMTKEEVIDASQGAAKAYSGTDQDAGAYQVVATAPYTGLGFQFLSLFMFDWKTHGLIGVKLNLLDKTKCDALTGGLVKTYGSPLETGADVVVKTMIWRDYAKKNVIKFRGTASYCQIIYSPIIETGPSGGL